MKAPRKPKVKPPLERVVQKQVAAYLKLKGWSVWQTSQGHKHPTGAKGLRITPGIPDLYALHPMNGSLWVEVKRENGKLSDAQRHFRDRHLGGIHNASKAAWCVVHSLDDMREYLGDLRDGEKP